MDYIRFVFLSLIFFSAVSLPAVEKGDPARVAILDVKSYGVEKNTGFLLRDFIEVAFYRTGFFEILERNRIDIIMARRGIASRQCFDLDCALRVGKVLSLDYVVIGSVGGSPELSCSMRIIDVKKGTVAFAGSLSAGSSKGLKSAAGKLVEKAMAQYSERAFVPIEKTNVLKKEKPVFSYGYALVPGLYQVKNGCFIRGYTVMGVFMSGLAVTGYAFYRYRQSRNAYDSLGPDDLPATFDDRFKKSENDFIFLNVSIGICCAIYLYNWIDALFFTDRKYEKKIVFILPVPVITESDTTWCAGVSISLNF